MTPEQLEAHRVRFEQAFDESNIHPQMPASRFREGEEYGHTTIQAAWNTYKWVLADADRAQRAAPGVQGGEPPKWIDDPHDIEQGRMLNPAWLSVHGLTAKEASIAIQPPQQSAQPVAAEPVGIVIGFQKDGPAIVDHEGTQLFEGMALYAAAQPVEVQRAPALCQFGEGPFKVWKKDESDLHSAWFVVMPGGPMLEFNHHADDAVDEARARWVCCVLNNATPRVPLTTARKNAMRVEYADAQPEDAARAYYSFIAGIEWAEREHGIKPTSSEGGA